LSDAYAQRTIGIAQEAVRGIDGVEKDGNDQGEQVAHDNGPDEELGKVLPGRQRLDHRADERKDGNEHEKLPAGKQALVRKPGIPYTETVCVCGGGRTWSTDGSKKGAVKRVWKKNMEKMLAEIRRER
jgi:hypothetical protein